MAKQPPSLFWLSVKFYWKHAWMQKWLFIGVILTSVISWVAITINPFFYKQLIDNLTEAADITILFNTVGLILAFKLIEWVSSRVNGFIGNYYFANAINNIGIECFRYLHRHSYNFFINNFVGTLVKRVNRLEDAFDILSEQFLWYFLPILIQLIGTIILIYQTNVSLVLIMITWTVIYIVISVLFAKYKFKLDQEVHKNDSRISGFVADSVTNNFNISLFSSHKREMNNYLSILADWKEAFLKAFNISTIMQAIQAITMIITEFILLVMGIQLWEKGLLSVGDFVLLQSLVATLFSRLWDFGNRTRRVAEAFSNGMEMIEILNTPHQVQDVQGAKQLHVAHGEIDFKNVGFWYSPEVNVFDNFSLHIPAKKKIALVSKSGGGKSTLTKLIMRFYDITSGEIQIDGQNIAKVTQDSLRKVISFVPQEPILFHRSLRENISYGKPNARIEEIIEASKKAHCHEFISQLKDGYETFVGERGIKLSGGERQRVAIARAILENAPILILDEATSSLDSESERFIQDALKVLMEDKTTIVIAHRLSTIMMMDEIIVIENGVITEQGTHDELSRQPNGHYAKLWKFQAGDYQA